MEIKQEEAHFLTMQSPTLLQTENKKDSKLTPSTKEKREYLMEVVYLLILVIKSGRNRMTYLIVMEPDLKVRLMTVF